MWKALACITFAALAAIPLAGGAADDQQLGGRIYLTDGTFLGTTPWADLTPFRVYINHSGIITAYGPMGTSGGWYSIYVPGEDKGIRWDNGDVYTVEIDGTAWGSPPENYSSYGSGSYHDVDANGRQDPGEPNEYSPFGSSTNVLLWWPLDGWQLWDVIEPGLTVSAPSGVSARLENPASWSDVNVTWAPSEDVAMMLDHYEVWYGTVYDSSGGSYVAFPTCTLVPSVQMWCVHFGGGDSDPASYFYQVRAVTETGAVLPAATQGAKVTQILGSLSGPRWDLVSLPVATDDSPAEVFRTHAGVETIRAFDARDGGDPWEAAALAGGSTRGDLGTLGQGRGVWVRTTGQDSWSVAGSVPAFTAVRLSSGWNLVGYPGQASQPVASALAGLWGDPVIGLEGFDPAGPYHLRALAGSDLLEPGAGYWIESKADSVWFVAS